MVTLRLLASNPAVTYRFLANPNALYIFILFSSLCKRLFFITYPLNCFHVSLCYSRRSPLHASLCSPQFTAQVFDTEAHKPIKNFRFQTDGQRLILHSILSIIQLVISDIVSISVVCCYYFTQIFHLFHGY